MRLLGLVPGLIFALYEVQTGVDEEMQKSDIRIIVRFCHTGDDDIAWDRSRFRQLQEAVYGVGGIWVQVFDRDEIDIGAIGFMSDDQLVQFKLLLPNTIVLKPEAMMEVGTRDSYYWEEYLDRLNFYVMAP